MGRSKALLALSMLVLILACALGLLYPAYTELRADYERLKRDYERAVAEADVVVLNDRDYHGVALQLVEAANKSIYVIMYVVKYDPDDPDDPVNQLMWALGNASERGVKVAVIIDGETAEASRGAYEYLTRVGVNATWDAEGVRTHCKLLVVDELFVLIGSHNWTESAMRHNRETSVLIRSAEVAKLEIKYFNEVWAEARGG